MQGKTTLNCRPVLSGAGEKYLDKKQSYIYNLPMKLQVNGKDMTVAEGATVASLLESLGLSDKRVAVEHNRVILARDGYDGPLGEGDVLEIISFVGGG